MAERNMGLFDRVVRIVLGLALILVGLALVGEWHGVLIAIIGLLPILAGVTGVCPLYIPFGYSTYKGASN